MIDDLDYSSLGSEIIEQNELFVRVIVRLKLKSEKHIYLKNESLSIYNEIVEQLIGEVLENERNKY